MCHSRPKNGHTGKNFNPKMYARDNKTNPENATALTALKYSYQNHGPNNVQIQTNHGTDK